MSRAQPIRELVTREGLRLLHKGVMRPLFPLAFQRRWIVGVSFLAPLPRSANVERVELAPVPTRKLTSSGTEETNGAILYLHGGGYVTGSWRTQKTIGMGLGKAAALPVYMPEYRLAPEHPFPAARDDALASYQWLLEQGLEPSSIVLAGDSAGGGLALSTALAIRDEEMPQPGALYLISPWVDLTMSNPSVEAKRRKDAALHVEWVGQDAAAYAGPAALDDPGVSPLFADHAGLPPTLIHAGSEEIFVGECRELAERLRVAGVDSELIVFDGMWHEFQVHAPLLRRSVEALDAAGAFIRAYA